MHDGQFIMYFEKSMDGINAIELVIRNVVRPSPVPRDTRPRRRDQSGEFGKRFSSVHFNVVRSRCLHERKNIVTDCERKVGYKS